MSGSLVLMHSGRTSVTARALARKLASTHRIIDVRADGFWTDASLPWDVRDAGEVSIVALGTAALPALTLAASHGDDVARMVMCAPALPRSCPELSRLGTTSTPTLVVTTVGSRACRGDKERLESVLGNVEYCRLPYPWMSFSPRIAEFAADIIGAYVDQRRASKPA